MYWHQHRRTLICLLAVVATLTAVPAVAGVVIVAHPDVPVDAVAGGDLQKMFLGKTTQWSDGTAVAPAVLADGPGREEFLKSHVRKSPSQFKTFWKKAVFAGTGTPPAEFATAAEMIAFVESTPGAVGFVAEGDATGAAKVLATQ